MGELVTFEGPVEDERGGGEVTSVDGGVVDWPILSVVGSKGGTSGGTNDWLLCTEASWIIGGDGFSTCNRIEH